MNIIAGMMTPEMNCAPKLGGEQLVVLGSRNAAPNLVAGGRRP